MNKLSPKAIIRSVLVLSATIMLSVSSMAAEHANATGNSKNEYFIQYKVKDGNDLLASQYGKVTDGEFVSYSQLEKKGYLKSITSFNDNNGTYVELPNVGFIETGIKIKLTPHMDHGKLMTKVIYSNNKLLSMDKLIGVQSPNMEKQIYNGDIELSAGKQVLIPVATVQVDSNGKSKAVFKSHTLVLKVTPLK